MPLIFYQIFKIDATICLRVTAMQVLGVTISSDLTMGCHLDEILSSSAPSIHALRMLRSHGLVPHSYLKRPDRPTWHPCYKPSLPGGASQ